MVCCTMIAALFGLFLRPWRRRDPLAWRPGRPPVTGFAAARMRSLGYAVAGLAFAIRNETNMRVHLFVAILTVAAGVALRIEPAEWRWLVVSIALVVAAEAINTGIEQACDAIGGRSEAIRRAKDAAAGGVLVLAAAAALIGIGIFGPHLVALWHEGLPASPLCSAS